MGADWKHGRIGSFVLEKPMVIGHESAGIIAKVGPNVQHLRVGDRVAIEPGESCRTCRFCKTGQYNLCPGMKFFATPPCPLVSGVHIRTAHPATSYR